MRNAYSVLKYPIATEKTFRMVELENKLLFVIDLKSNKTDVKKAVEEAFNVKVETVNTYTTSRGSKRAYVKLNKENPAIDVMTKLGLM